MNNVYEFDVVIVGAGVIGLSIAWELSNVYDNILLIEKEEFDHVITKKEFMDATGLQNFIFIIKDLFNIQNFWWRWTSE